MYIKGEMMKKEKYPTPMTIAEGGYPKKYAIIKKMKRIESIVIDNEFDDDHLPCFEMTVKTDVGILRTSLWWCDREEVIIIYCSADGVEKRLKELHKWISEDCINN